MSDLPFILYHGTSSGYLGSILKDGLLPQSSGDGYLCWTDTFELAVHHAKCMAEWDQGILGVACSPVVFEVPISEFDVTAFCLDERFISVGPSGGRACNPEMAHHIKNRADFWTWQELLGYAGVVGYSKSLKVNEDMIVKNMEPDVFALASRF